jgi:hypothetical protein
MVRRCVFAGMIEAQCSVRRIKGCRDMRLLFDAEVIQRLANEERGIVTPPNYDQAAA